MKQFSVMNMTFERGALSLVGGLVIALVSVAALHPPAAGTAKPVYSVLQRAEALVLSSGLLPRAMIAAAEPERSMGDLIDMDVASGDTDIGPTDVVASASSLSDAFGRMGYKLDSVIEGSQPVPRLFLSSLPNDLSQVAENSERKEIFFRSVLPLVLQANEEILADRRRLWKLRYQTRLGQKAGPADRLWLQVMGEMYRVKRGDIDALLTRIDIVPPSLALAQAAEESGWGTSRFVREGNAMFGQWTFSSKKGLVPTDREEGKTHKVRAFDSLIDSVRAYALNLNSNRAYRELRRERAQLRRNGNAIDGRILAGTLKRYSQRGEAYIVGLRGLIDSNGLSSLDDARLVGPTI